MAASIERADERRRGPQQEPTPTSSVVGHSRSLLVREVRAVSVAVTVSLVVALALVVAVTVSLVVALALVVAVTVSLVLAVERRLGFGVGHGGVGDGVSHLLKHLGADIGDGVARLVVARVICCSRHEIGR